MASMLAYVGLLSFDGTAHASSIVERRAFSCDADREPARQRSPFHFSEKSTGNDNNQV
jgi:hypothetical protein